MALEKILIPAYKREGSCERCGAEVYVPDLKENGGWPSMSACVCEGGPKFAGRQRSTRRAVAGAAELEEQAQAA